MGRGGPGPRGAGSIGREATARIDKCEATGTYSRLRAPRHVLQGRRGKMCEGMSESTVLADCAHKS